ncbi:hypothetical protein SEPCBS57363_000377 [Sporothrix epigloea]|uniref:DUF7820 domain-containing protein n=1 Tax=Sporothrix epigloea TaxID=1892477 RepID=A0ABP0D4Q7_9PEZI
MDHSDESTSELEQRDSPCLPESVPIHADANALNAMDEDSGSCGTVMTVSDGFSPCTETIIASSPALVRTSDAQNADGNEGRSVTGSAHGGDNSSIAATTANGPATQFIPPEINLSVSSSSSSSAPDASSIPNSLSTSSAPSQPSGPPIFESRPSPTLLEPTLSVPSAQSTSLAAARPSNTAKSSIGQLTQSMPLDGASASARSASCPLANVHDEEPYQGPSGPSFPYQLYPQDVNMTRPLSAGEASAIGPPESLYDGPRRPAFPYTMYPQNTVASSNSTPVTVPGVPVGFPGVVDNYRRRIGPDGEDIADLVGPDGHTEQLPPYTRYPDEAYNRKIAAADAALRANTTISSLAESSEETIAAHPTVAPVTAQNDILESIPSPESSTAEVVPAESASIAAPGPVPVPQPAQVSTSGPDNSIPGAGGIGLAPRNPEFDGRQHPYQPKNYNTMSVTVTVDASPIPTPSNLPSLPTGTFSLPFAIDESPSSCFNDTTKSQAWQCNIADQSSMTLTIASLGHTADGPTYGITINSNESATYQNNVFLYGEQAPTITMQSDLKLVENTLDSGRGPAWFKMVTYNKTVIVRENYLTAPNSQPTSTSSVERNDKKRRQFNGKAGLASRACYPGHKCSNTAQVGEKPWVCTWPDTILEIFIYPEQNSSACGGSVASTSMPTSTPLTPILASSLMSLNGSSKTLSYTSNTAPSMAPSKWLNLPPPYSRVVTMEERRMANSPEATCVQYELTLVGTALKAVRNLDANGQPIQLTIAEIESGPSFCPKGKRDASGDAKASKKRDESVLSKCGCLWMVT